MASLDEALQRAERFNAQFPGCVFHAAPCKRRGVYRVAFYVHGRRRPAFTM